MRDLALLHLYPLLPKRNLFPCFASPVSLDYDFNI